MKAVRRVRLTTHPYRIAAERADSYLEAWNRLRTRRLVRRIAVGVFVCVVTTAIVIGCKTGDFQRGPVVFPVWEYAGLSLGVVFLLLTFMFGRYLVPFLCPRCEQPFFHGLFTEIGFTKNCVNCHLAVGTPMPSSSEREAV